MTMLSSLVHSPIITCHRLLGSLAILVYMEGDEKRFALDTFKQAVGPGVLGPSLPVLLSHGIK